MKIEVPIFMVTGFLESGKTRFIKEVIEEGNFDNTAGPILVICTEDGEEEYGKDFCLKNRVMVEKAGSVEEMKDGFFGELNKKYKPAVVLIEYNGMWDPGELFECKKPKNWHLVEVISIIDSTTYDIYMANMKSIITRFIGITDMVVINRCAKDMDKMSVRRVLRAVNPRMQIIFENTDGTTDDGRGDGEVPYDLEADPIEVEDEDYGIFYVETMDNPKRYDGKRVKIKGITLKNNNMAKDQFALARPAMTCCEDDISLAAFLNWYSKSNTVKNKQWVEVTARMVYEFNDTLGDESIIFYTESIEECEPPQEEMVYFN